ncbi:uncharacterized protein [Elaeis guineensis]|uniref:Pistil-specific extensin-like protein n=1 Tax=Elaeis guineensis var. tenera TaxID=51953 RepID=A0A6I9RED8_ELAGV|nr:pistil-specific extensin-like protein [Elaeis guineensis]
MAWLRGVLFGLQFLVLFLGSVPSPAECAYGGKLPPPSPSPSPPPNTLKPTHNVSVEGDVYCRCKLPGYVTPKDASPLPGVLVSFKHGRRSWSGKTDARGHFLVNAKFPSEEKDVKTSVAKYGKVYVVSTPLPACTVPEFLGHKGKGASVFYERDIVAGYDHVALFSAGVLDLGPANSKMCHT